MRRREDRRQRRDHVARAYTRSAKSACTGLHGANRLASNSLLEGLVVAHRACEASCASIRRRTPARSIALPAWQPGDVQDVDELVVIYHNWDEIRRLMWDYVGIVRTNKRCSAPAPGCAICSARSRSFIGTSRSRSNCWNCATSRRSPRSSWTQRSAGRKAAGCISRSTIRWRDDRHFKRDTLVSRT